jgi:hypothetical protein
MVSSVLIIVVSAGLLAYWFRYTCLLILSTHTTRDYATGMAAANSLKFQEVQVDLARGAAAESLPELERLLARDYQLITYLLANAAGFRVGGVTLEQRMLMLDFQLMRCQYAITRRLAASRARTSLKEMANILAYFANSMGERLQAYSQA